MGIIYLLIAFLATCLGSMTGAAGGVIIKPVIDLIGEYDAITIGLLSGITLIFMALVNIGSHFLKKTVIDFTISIPITLGAIIGGIIGGQILSNVNSAVGDERVKVVQNILLIIFMIASLYYGKNKSKLFQFNLNGKFVLIIIGIFLGIISCFLGIGGGPINVSILILFLSFTNKEAAVYSIFIVIFSQSSKIISFMVQNDINKYDLHILPYMVIGGIAGGYLGAKFNTKFSENKIVCMFNLIQIFVILTAVINIFKHI